MAVLKYYNTATSAWEYIAASTTANFTTWKKTVAGGETSVSGTDDNAVTLSYTVGLEQVFINGVLQVRGSDYTATTGTSITGLSALAVNDVVTVICYAPFNVANTIAPTLVDAKGDLIVATAADTVGRLAVGTNGQHLIADSSTATGLKYAPVVAFDAYRDSTTQSINSAAFTKVQLNAEAYDTNNNFDPTTNYRFTPTIAGYYQINAICSFTQNVAAAQIVIYKNGGEYKRGNNMTADWVNVSTLVYCNGSTDYIELYIAHLAGAARNLDFGQSKTSMQGILVREA